MNKKGLSPTMWLVIAIVVIVIIALTVSMVVNNTSTTTGRQSSGSIDSSNEGIKNAMCQTVCDECNVRYGADCTGGANKWGDMKGTNCASFTCS